MDTILLNQIAPNRGVVSTNYFNGRPLAAEDLTTDQASRRQQIAQLGRAVGAGVAYGLQVHPAPDDPGSVGPSTSVTVAAGLAVNRRGRPLSLPADIRVALTVTNPPASSGPGLFADCQPPQASATVVSSGVYLLTIGPASDYEGAVASVDLSGADPILSGCGRALLVEGVQFRMVGLNLAAFPGIPDAALQAVQGLFGSTDPAQMSLLRNRLAHLFFGSDDWRARGTSYDQVWAGDSPGDPFGLLGPIRAAGLLSDCDVPLAMIYWTQAGIGFVDRWAVRRGIEPMARDLGFPLVAASARALAHAVLCQFQEQVEELAAQIATNPTLAAGDLSTLFAYLPPAGAVPIGGPNSPVGFSLAGLFGTRAPAAPTVLTLGHLAGLLQEAETRPPVAVASLQVLQLYWIRENYQANSQGQNSQLYAVFADRGLHGFLENDDVVLLLTQAWNNYARVLRTMAILPNVMTNDSLPAWTAIFAVLQNLVQFTLVKATAAGAGDLDVDAVFQTFRDLFALQNTLMQAMGLSFSGDTGATARHQKATDLNQLLQSTLSDGSPGLGPSLQAADFRGVVRAQGQINDLVYGWGALSSVGGLNVNYVGSDKGLTAVPGATTTLTFNLNSQLLDFSTVLLAASVVQAKAGDWSTAVTVQTTDGKPLVSVDIAPQQTIPFLVKVATPGGLADFGDVVRVEVVATLPTQTVQPSVKDVDLTLSAGGGVEQAYTLTVTRFPASLPPTSTGQQNQPSTFTFQSTFAATRPPTSLLCTFTAKFTFTNTTPADWTITIPGQAPTFDPATGTLTYQFPLPPPPPAVNPNVLTQIQLTPKFAPDHTKSCLFTVAVTGTVIDSQTNQTVSLSGSAAGGPFGVTFP